MTLNDREWGVFLIGDLFSVKRPPARNKDDYELGDVPFVASGSVNNGVMKCCKPLEDEKLDEAGCITVSPVDGGAFYQPYSFLGRGGAGSSILMLYADNINLYSGQFIAKMISNTCACKYTYGHMGNKDGIKRERIMLPVDENNHPDYQFMEDYAKELISKKREQYLDYCKEQLKTFERGGYNLIPLAEKQWKAFFIDEIFTISAGKRLTKADMDNGNIPFIGATDSNNGITSWIATPNVSFDKNVLGVNYNGSVVENFYHPYGCVFSDDVKRLHLKNHNDNKYILLFFKTVILLQKTKYTYGYKFNGKRMERQKILLPVNEYGNPDYDYMEKYSKNLMSRKIQSYIRYATN